MHHERWIAEDAKALVELLSTRKHKDLELIAGLQWRVLEKP
jgi:hypothetical protein